MNSRAKRLCTAFGIVVVLSFAIMSPVLVGVFAFNSVPTAVLASGLAFSLWATLRASARGKNIVLLLVAVSLSLTALDLVSRIVLTPILFPQPERRFARVWPSLPFLWRYKTDVEHEGLSFGDLASLTPAKETRVYREVRFVTDSRGFRNDLENESRTRDVDVIVLGDSFGFGQGTTQQRTWVSLLEKTYGLRTYNMSVSAYGPARELSTLKHEVNKINIQPGKTTVLWMIFAGNDLDDECYLPSQEPRVSGLDRFPIVVSIRSFRLRSPIHELLRRALPRVPTGKDAADPQVLSVQLFGRTVLFQSKSVAWTRRTADEVMEHPNYACIEATVDAMKQLTAEKQLNLAIVLAPSKQEVYSWALEGDSAWSTRENPSGFAAALAEMSDRQDIPFIDLKPFFIRASRQTFTASGALLWWPDDTHWNAHGNRLAASVIQDQLLVPLTQGQ